VLMLDRLPSIHPLHFDVEQIAQAADRATALTRQLLSLSRPRPHQPRVINLNLVLQSSEGLLRRILGATINLVFDLEPNLRLIEADPTQIEQVLLNLVVNARDAMPHGGVVRIQTANILPRHSLAMADAAHNASVMLRVSDTGTGMDRATIEQIFKPFFTTKLPEDGTGLGLAIVHSIVTQSGGQIRATSTPGQGSVFTITLPQALAEPADAWAALPQGAVTILVLDDEPLVRELAARVLRGQGYEVIEAEDAAAAMRLLARPHPIHLLLISSTLHGPLNGRQLAVQLRAQLPSLKVLYMSGYPSSVLIRHGMLEAEQLFLSKPFTRQTLLRRVWEALYR
jgi:two-component system, cell cycle sensor histidine kinase and response regulator CckA